MRFRYIGEEYTEWFGFKWMTGTVHDVTDEHAVKKLAGSALFEAVEEPAAAAPEVLETPKPKLGRPRKVVVEEANDHHNAD